MTIKTVFFDIGGVLLSNGWDSGSRKKAVTHFLLNEKDFNRRHEMIRYALDTGRVTLDEYLSKVIFNVQRSFTKEDFVSFMRSESIPYPDTIALLNEVRAHNKRIYSLNNESRELHEYRVQKFDLHRHFDAFFCSCYLGAAKPEEAIYLQALGMANAKPDESVLVDDREVNIETAQALGFNVVHHQDVEKTRRCLVEMGILNAKLTD